MSETQTTTAQRPRGDVTIVEPSRSERILGRRAAETRATVPSLELSARVEIDPSAIAEETAPRAIAGHVAVVLARTLREHPRLNSAYRDGHYEYFSRVNVGVTLIAEGVFATPTVFDADQCDGTEVAAQLAALEAQLRGGEELPSAQTAGATFTLLDLTGYAGISSQPLITAPQAGALAIGLTDAAPASGAAAGVALELRLALDNRIVWGHEAFSFLDDLRTTLRGDAR